jgi:tRNA threonylcarbamoyladenosine modification (KEOPS) complex Cgi121 subunit
MINKFMVSVVGVRTKAKTPQELFSKLAELSKKHSILLQAFNPDSILSIRQLEHAYEISIRSFEGKANIARTLEAEILLRASGSAKIAKAIEKVGVKDPKRVILFSPSGIPASLIAELGEEDKTLLKQTEKKKKLIANLFGIGRELKLYSLEELVLEKIAFSD